MATSYPPNPPPPPNALPPRQNNAALAVVLGIVIVLGVMIAFGVFVGGRFLQNTHLTETKSGAQHLVEIHSPLGDLMVNDSGDKTKVDIRSPFGNLKVNTTPDPARLGIEIYPGAVLVQSRRDSPFHHGVDFGDGGAATNNSDSTGAQVQLSHGDAVLEVNVAEFRTPATPDQVLGYYANLLGKVGPVQRRREPDGATSLKVRLSKRNMREAAVKPGGDGTHFVLIRVVGDRPAR